MRYAYWLDQVLELSSGKKRYLAEAFPDLQELYELPAKQLEKIAHLTEEDRYHIESHRRLWEADKEWYALMAKGIGFVYAGSEEFPEKLQNIPSPPYALYYIGQLPRTENPRVAIVGARGRSAYGQEIALELGKALSDHGISVVSGMAKGIDTDAHKGALSGNGDTYAVLGCGVDVCYPRSNRYLYEEISRRGGILSEFLPGTQPQTTFFPRRNRIISGLSDCVVVVEAKERSGSLITADFAMEQGKDVYAVPGRLCDPLSAGCNQLIKQGAGLIVGVEDFLKDLEIFTENFYTQIDFRKNLLEKDESMVYSLTDFRPTSVGVLMDKSTIPIARLFEILERLLSLGLIKETFPGYYVRRIFK